MKAHPLSTSSAINDAAPISAPSGRAEGPTPRPASQTNHWRPPLRRAFSVIGLLSSVEVRFRFRVRTLLLATTAVSIVFGLYSARVHRLQATVAKIEGRGGAVVYDSFRAATEPLPVLRQTLTTSTGEGWFSRPVAVIFPPQIHVGDDDLRLVSRLGSVETIHLDGFLNRDSFADRPETRRRVTDRGLAYLEKMPRLRQLTLRGAAVTPTGVAAFRQRRPDCWVIDDPAETLAFFRL